MFLSKKKLVLASASPRRQQYLNELNLEFEVNPADIDEQAKKHEMPVDYVLRMAKSKFVSVAELHPEKWVLSADTIVFLEGKILGKPESEKDAVEILMFLSGKSHTVTTAFCLGCIAEGICHVESVSTSVLFSPFSKEMADAYVQTGESLDKAGGYGIQGRGGFFVKEVKGSYSNVVGLPMAEVLSALIQRGIIKTTL